MRFERGVAIRFSGGLALLFSTRHGLPGMPITDIVWSIWQIFFILSK
jgi:hypothetical protein